MSQSTSNSQPVAQAELVKPRTTRGSSCFSFETKPAENWQKFRRASNRELPRTNLRLHLKNQRTGANGPEKVDMFATSTTTSATTLSKTSSVSSGYTTKRRQLIPKLTLFVLIISCHLLVYVAAANIAAALPAQSQALQQQQPRSRETLHAIYIQMLANQSQLKQQSDNRISETEPQQQNPWQFEPQAAQMDASSSATRASGRWAPTDLDMDMRQPYDMSSDRVPLLAGGMPEVSSESSSRQYVQQAPTTPTLNHQLMPPSQPFYEFSFAPTNALILEPQQENYNTQQHNPVALQSNNKVANLTTAGRADSLAKSASEGVGTQRAPSDALHNSLAQKLNQPELPTTPATTAANSVIKSQGSSQKKSSLDVVERSIEPRQNRRVLSRILQKAEWNNLFVKLSKVLLKHLLEMALKDIVGKQSGDAASDSGATDSTTGRKKFDTQSEVADLFKDFVKTAVSNL